MLRKLERLGTWSARRPRRALAIWFLFLVGCLAFGALTGTNTLDNGSAGASKRGYNLGDRYDLWGYPTEAVLVRGANSGPAAAAVHARLAEVNDLGPVSGPLRSRDGRSALIYFDLHRGAAMPKLEQLVRSVARERPDVSVGLTGDISVERARDAQSNADLSRSEKLSLQIALLVLFLVFGALVAASVPVLLALTAVAAALGLVGPLSQIFAMDDSAKTVLVLIGMAVGVDYSLFYVARYRQERRAGHDQQAALATTARTSGHTIVISGLTVAAALAGLFVAGEVALSSVAAATIAVVLCA